MEQGLRIFVAEQGVFPDLVKHQDILAIILRSLFCLFHILQPSFIGGDSTQPQTANSQYEEDFFHYWD